MLLGFIYQVKNGESYKFPEVDMKASMNNYMRQVKIVMKEEEKVVARWTFKKRMK